MTTKPVTVPSTSDAFPATSRSAKLITVAVSSAVVAVAEVIAPSVGRSSTPRTVTVSKAEAVAKPSLTTIGNVSLTSPLAALIAASFGVNVYSPYACTASVPKRPTCVERRPTGVMPEMPKIRLGLSTSLTPNAFETAVNTSGPTVSVNEIPAGASVGGSLTGWT